MTREESIEVYNGLLNQKIKEAFEFFAPELAENDDDRIRRKMIEHFKSKTKETWCNMPVKDIIAYLEKQKENPKSADSIPSDCMSDAKCEDRWHKVGDSLPDNGRLVLAQDCLGNTLLARYDGEGNWEVSVYDKDDYYCRNTITKWCEIPSEKQKEQKQVPISCGHENGTPAEWSEEDKEKIVTISEIIEHCTTIPYSGGTLTLNKEYKKELQCFIKSLRPDTFQNGNSRPKSPDNWKPSEEQMGALLWCTAHLGGADHRVLAELYEHLKKL